VSLICRYHPISIIYLNLNLYEADVDLSVVCSISSSLGYIESTYVWNWLLLIDKTSSIYRNIELKATTIYFFLWFWCKMSFRASLICYVQINFQTYSSIFFSEEKFFTLKELSRKRNYIYLFIEFFNLGNIQKIQNWGRRHKENNGCHEGVYCVH
jgi:hypothetical protein